MKHVEDQIQKHLMVWIRNRQTDLLKTAFHCPNGGMRDKIEAARFKGMGVKAGVPDILIPLPDGKILWFELKKQKGTLSKVQKEFHEMLTKLDHVVLVGYGLKDSMEKLEAFESSYSSQLPSS